MATGEEVEGAPLFRNRTNAALYKHGDGTWGVGPSPTIKSVGTAPCPARVSQWLYWDRKYGGGGGYKSGDIRVQCS